MPGLFGDMFDFNHDGKLDSFEQAAEFMFFNDVIMKNNDASDFEDDEMDDDE